MKIAVNGNKEIEISVPHGTTPPASPSTSSKFIKTKYQENLLAELMQTYAVSDLCLIGKITLRFNQLNSIPIIIVFSIQVLRAVASPQ